MECTIYDPNLHALAAADRGTVVVVSPHMDDAVWSIGGLIAALASSGARVIVATAFSEITAKASTFGREFLNRGGLDAETATIQRRKEDTEAIRLLGAKPCRLGLLDAICRLPATYTHKYRIAGASARVAANDPGPEQLRRSLDQLVCAVNPVMLLAPLGIGSHVDHQVVAKAALDLVDRHRPTFFFEDFPYAILSPFVLSGLPAVAADRGLHLSPEVVQLREQLPLHLKAAARYTTQTVSFFDDVKGFTAALHNHLHSVGAACGQSDLPAIRLWRPRRIIRRTGATSPANATN